MRKDPAAVQQLIADASMELMVASLPSALDGIDCARKALGHGKLAFEDLERRRGDLIMSSKDRESLFRLSERLKARLRVLEKFVAQRER
jgi:hypothetical protein